jgi:molybdopterin synthase catalytic subunit
MHVEMLYFAVVRERTGRSSERFELPDGATLDTLAAALLERHPTLRALLPHVRWARNEAFVPVDAGAQTLVEGDRVALIPPVSGGAPAVGLTTLPIDPRDVEALVQGPGHGGCVTFIGTVRDRTGDHAVLRLEYEAYVEMAEGVLQRIVDETHTQFPGSNVALRHRLGRLEIGEVAVVVAVSAPHRAAAFDACRQVIERVKVEVPIFKKEVRADGSVWVGLGP